MRKLVTAALFLSLLSVLPVAADTITFNTFAVGSVGTYQATVGAPGIQVTAFYFTAGAWQHANLFQRNSAPDDVGLGVCDPTETSNCGTGQGGGDFNEISNENKPEIVRIALPTGYHWVNVQLSSLDNNGGGESEHGVLYGNSTGTPGAPGAIGSQVCAFASTGFQTCTSTGGTNPVISIGGNFADSQFLYLEARDWNLPSNHNNDFLLRAVTVTAVTPEPGTIVLLGSGLIGMGGYARRRFKK